MTCEHCSTDVMSLVIHANELWCRSCHNSTRDHINPSTMIATDDIPGGYYVKNGICNDDGSPRRFDSKSDIRRAAFEAGYAIGGETPKVNQRLREQRLMEKERRNADR